MFVFNLFPFIFAFAPSGFPCVWLNHSSSITSIWGPADEKNLHSMKPPPPSNFMVRWCFSLIAQFWSHQTTEPSRWLQSLPHALWQTEAKMSYDIFLTVTFSLPLSHKALAVQALAIVVCSLSNLISLNLLTHLTPWLDLFFSQQQ